ncbi:NHL repeat-containing protein [Cohnella abietis]|uniref:Uncharacterized protein n=1 Tax=Cohnella abietis TaxID=2507935 RepID=A0A3T1D0G0_9BACL|nr:PQQ-binding-like beta-propeller repeat protein [Cohnella abietis]BBI31592.1 hypothetical protein KCTCHS21_09910 [Cohnella abietis]
MKPNLLAAIPEQHARFIQLPNAEGHNAVWDFVRSPNGRFYVTVCGENEKPLTALLYEYEPKTGALRLIFDVAKIWIVSSEEMPPSKIHTSIDFLPDGRLIMATHNTAPAPNHKQWMFEQHYEHPWEGYPGSILMIVNPDTNEVQVKGIPVPRESIYGGMLGNDPRYYYFLGYMRGHFYRIDLETNEVKDYGKVSEFSSCRLVKDAQGRFYGSSYTGSFWRYDPTTDEIEDLKLSFLPPSGTKHRRQFIFALHTPRNTLLLVSNMDGEIIELHPETLEVTRHGSILPDHVPSINGYGIGGFAADKNFVIYYGLKTHDEYCPIRLVRWDLLGGGKPENLGLITWGGKDSQYICEMIFDDEGLLHMVDVCGEFSPYILTVDVDKLEPPGVEAAHAALRPYVEPDYNGVGKAAFMHIDAKEVSTLPLHQHMGWKDTAVSYVYAASGRVYTLGGQQSLILTESEYSGNDPLRIRTIYENGAPLSSIQAHSSRAYVLTTDNKILLVDLIGGSCEEAVVVPQEIKLKRLLHADLDEGGLLISDSEGSIFVYSEGSFRKLKQLQIQPDEGHIIKLDSNRLLLSGQDDEIVIYDIKEESSEVLNVKSASIRGRMFKATITGGVVLSDGTVVAGTLDGMLFCLTPDLQTRTVYGRFYSNGQLRHFIKRSNDEVLGIYGGVKEAGHVFHYSREHGFVDLGRPRMIKDNAELNGRVSEFGNIHHISAVTYDNEGDCLCVASAELYGCVIRYTGVVFP